MAGIELPYDTKATLGEGPVWDARMQTLYWLDILNKRVYANADVLAESDDFIGCRALRKSGGLALTKRFSFASLSLNPFQETFLAALTDESANNRFNDGKCDPGGVFRLETKVEGMPVFDFAG